MGDSITAPANMPAVTSPAKRYTLDLSGKPEVVILPNVQISDQEPGQPYFSRTWAYQLPIYFAARPNIKLLNNKLELFIKPQAAVSLNSAKTGHELQWAAGIKGGIVYTINPDSALKVSPELAFGADYSTGDFPLLSPYFYNGAKRTDALGRISLNFAPGRGFRLAPYGEFSQTYFQNNEYYGRDSRVRLGLNGILAFAGSRPGKFKAVPNLHFDFGAVAWSKHYAERTDFLWYTASGGSVIGAPLEQNTSYKFAVSDLTLALSWDKLPYVIPSLNGGISGTSHDNDMISNWVQENYPFPSVEQQLQLIDCFPMHYWVGFGLNFAPAIDALLNKY